MGLRLSNRPRVEGPRGTHVKIRVDPRPEPKREMAPSGSNDKFKDGVGCEQDKEQKNGKEDFTLEATRVLWTRGPLNIPVFTNFPSHGVFSRSCAPPGSCPTLDCHCEDQESLGDPEVIFQ